MTTRERFTLLLAALWIVGSALQIAVYQSIWPAVFAIVLMGAGTVVLSAGRGSRATVGTFNSMFVVGWVAAGVSAVYAVVLKDPIQLESDAHTLFELSSGGSKLGIAGLVTITEGSGAVIVWRSAYQAASLVLSEPEPFVGIAVNVLVVALGAAIGVGAAGLLFPGDRARAKLLGRLHLSCGLLWLFAGLHLRDAFTFTAVSALCFVWLRYLLRPLSVRVWEPVAATVVGTAIMGFLRTEFAFLPPAMLVAAVGALSLSPGSTLSRRGATYAVVTGAVAALALWIVPRLEVLLLALEVAGTTYTDLAVGSAGEGSLGVGLIASQPLPVRVVFGSLYLLVFPIPFWHGFSGESAYYLFKSANVLLFYVLIPMVVVGIASIPRIPFPQRTSVLFLAGSFVGFLGAIAGTSMESRHLGSFLLPLFLLAILPDLDDVATRRLLNRLWSMMAMGVVLVHTMWTVLKLV